MVALFALSACSTRKATSGTHTLSSKTWTLLSAGAVDAGSSGAYIEFGSNPGEVRGKAGCNGFGGNYTAEGSRLKLEGLMGTKMACPALDVENAFLRALEATERYEIKGDSLLLYQGDNLVATFKAGSVSNCL